MFTDPQTITVSGVAKTMPKILSDGMKAVYQTSDSLFTETISHQISGKPGSVKQRSLVRYDQKAIVADPLTAANDYETLSVQIVFERPEFGFTAAQQDAFWTAIKTQFNTAMSDKIFGRES